jgi:hypothetical protein
MVMTFSPRWFATCCLVTGLTLAGLASTADKAGAQSPAQSAQAQVERATPPEELPTTRNAELLLLVPGPIGPQTGAAEPRAIPAFPTGAGAWSMEVVTRGGIMGMTRRTAVDSGGSLQCPGQCTNLTGRQLQSLADAVRTAHGLTWGSGGLSTLCRDCIVTQFTVWRRAEGGGVESFTAQWDSSTAGRIDPAIRQIHDTVLAMNGR